MRKRLLKALLGSLLLVGSVALPAMPVTAQSEQVIGSPGISLSAQDNRIGPGEQTNVAVTISNSGDVRQSGPSQFVQRVGTARNVQASVVESQIDGPITVDTGTVTLGSLQDGSVQQATFAIETGADLEPGTYTLPIKVEYTHTSIVNYESTQAGYSNIEYVDRSRTKTVNVQLVVEEEPRFALAATSDNQLTVGGSDRFAFSVTNTGSEAAQDITVQLSSQNPTVQFGGASQSQAGASQSQSQTGSASQSQSQTSIFIPSLEPGEVYNDSVQVTSTSGSTPGQYPVQATVNYEKPNGVPGTSNTITVGGDILSEQTFALSDISSTLRVGEEGNVTATLNNQGPNTVDNAVISLQAPATGIEPQRTEFALGEFAAGSSETVRFPVTVSDSAHAGPYQFSYSVNYQGSDGTERASDALNTRVDIAQQRNIFDISGVNTSLQVGSMGTVELELTNNNDRPVHNINAKAYVDDPLSASSDKAYVATLEPGETTTIAFDVSVAGDASLRTQPFELDFQYEQADGDTVLSDTYQVPITLTPAPEGGLPVSMIVGVLAVLGVAIGGFIYFRR